MKSYKNKVFKLRQKIFYHNYLYHTLYAPMISDEKYDCLIRELQVLEEKYNLSVNTNSPTQKIGATIQRSCKLFSHLTPMLSLDNTFNINDYLKFEKKIKNILNIKDPIEICCELKIDGLALNLIYKEGKLINAVTRGDGQFGEDVTNNAIRMNTIPLVLKGKNIPYLMEIRGEVFIKNSDFLSFNQEFGVKKEKLFSNPRNVAAGSLRHNRSSTIIKRKLMFYAYGYNVIKGKDEVNNHYGKLQILKKWGLFIDNHTVLCTNVKEVSLFYYKIEKKRSLLDFNIDGIVLKINSVKFQKILGDSNRFPIWAIAVKFKSFEKITKVLHVDFQIGRTGIVTPVARVKPVEISGVIISNVSLHSKNKIDKIGLSVGDDVTVCRSGDVIPKIINVVKLNADTKRNNITFPKNCPICMYKIIQKKKDGHFYCSGGFNCIGQRKKAFYHFFSKKALNVQGLGYKLIDLLVDNDYVKNPVDFFQLKINELIKLDRIGVKSAKNILRSLNKSRSVVLSKVIYAFGIYGIGLTTAMLLSYYFKYLKKLIYVNQSDLLKIKGLGPTVSKNVYDFFHDNKKINFLSALEKELDIYPDGDHKFNIVNNDIFLSNKTIVITGFFNELSREKLIKRIEYLGGRVVNSISKKVNLIIVGKNPGLKLNRAKDMRIEEIYNIDFLLH
ncbi:NAD-dependent DNA ligase LigA [Buchnera aphidicola (Pemphigus obesinymphae)]|uniref:NAD-dependent DNA ligase LigA n=1 Tax=Buchnera aphidicola TaxID=9 RepID=UPI002238F18F|nr:NAD-dependent DNA ligase LigA [Buchnera aphidicola]MCW5196526.1 NAD-dependent DNA ligase LigA [Buchnera aphidicola (Pemphigus obesinymphae)]